MLRMGGSPARTYVMGDTPFAISSRFRLPPIHCTAYARALGPAIKSLTSVMPYQLMIAATFGTAVSLPVNPPPAQIDVRLAVDGIMPTASARCPPADSPLTTILSVSMLLFLALFTT